MTETDIQSADSGRHSCSQCREPLAAKAAFCRACGATQARPPALRQGEEPEPTKVASICGKCGAALARDSAFCRVCGSPVSADGIPTQGVRAPRNLTSAASIRDASGLAVSTPGSKRLTSASKRRIYVIAAGLAALAVVVLLVTGVLGGPDGDSGSAARASSDRIGPSSVGRIAELTGSDKLTGAVLTPTGGGAAGSALLGRRGERQVLLRVEATGLEPSPKGYSYSIWLYKSPKVALRVGAVVVDMSGGIRVQLPIPAQLLAYVASGAFDQVDISLTSDAEYEAALKKAKGMEAIPPYMGIEVLRGKLEGPLTEAASKAESENGS